MSTPRTWSQFGLIENEQVQCIDADPKIVALYGEKPVPVTLTEDETGDLRGWIEQGTDIPVMVQHKAVFDMQFPYASKVAVAAGEGVVVHLTATPN